MLKAIKNYLKKTALYAFYHRRRMIHEFWQWTPLDQRRLEFYRQFIAPGDLVFDVGANAGNRTKTFLKLGSRVVAFEPQNGCATYLAAVLNGNRNFNLVRMALGAREGEAKMLICDASTISTLSAEWVAVTQQSGRFSEYRWDQEQTVKITTLDAMIQAYGQPSFIKIDVEGYEYEVLSGLSKPVACASIEVVPECLDQAFKCIDHWNSLAKSVFQLALGENNEFALAAWGTADEIKAALRQLAPQDNGDVYMRSLASST